MKIGITGATGVLGSISTRKLTELGYEVAHFVGDIRDSVTVAAWLGAHELDVVLHYAATVAVDRVKADPLRAYDVNVCGTVTLLSEIVKSGQRPWFFYASTCHVYKSKDSAIHEEDEIAPVSLYGMSKYMGEKICLDFAGSEASLITICVGRIFSFFHETQKPPFLYPNIMKRLSTEDLSAPFFLYGADSERDFLNAEQVCDRIFSLMRIGSKGVFNIGSGVPTKIRDFVQGLTDRKLKIETNDEHTVLVANIEKLNAELENGAHHV